MLAVDDKNFGVESNLQGCYLKDFRLMNYYF